MNLFSFLRRVPRTDDGPRFTMEGGPTAQAFATLPPVAPPKAPNKQLALPSYLKTAKPSTQSPFQRTDSGIANLDITTLRVGADTREVIRQFTRASPDLSAAVTAQVRVGITKGYLALARNLDLTPNPEATNALMQVISRMDVLNDYTIGYDDSLSIRSLAEVWARDLSTQGACCGELVLNKARLPDKIQPIASVQIRPFPSSDGKKVVPKQFIAGEYIDLDVPTFFMVKLDEDILDPYPVSPIEPAIQAVIFSHEFMNDIRRVVRRAIHPRATMTIDHEKFLKTLPQDVTTDEEKLRAYMANVVSDVERQINGLKPEDALILFDTMGFSIEDHGNTNLSEEYKAVQGMADSKVVAGTKSMPTVLGKSNGTSNVASTESMLFVKYVEGAVWAKLNEMFSKIFTLALRLLGYDVVVEFRFNDIDLRPESELEAFKAMKQSRILELWSLGVLTDVDACLILTNSLPPPGMKPLSGTGFFNAKAAAPAGDGYNGETNSGSTMNQNLKGDAPKGAKSKNQGASAEIIPLAV